MVIITEDIIRNALNESIDEFMINEGGAWDGVKNWANKWGLNKAWNGIKNFAAEYMDKKTNGQWNKKYGIQAKGSGTNVGTYYLEKWLKPRYSRLYDIVYGNYYGDRTYFVMNINGRNLTFNHDWKNGSYALTDNNSGLTYRIKTDYNGQPITLSITNYNGIKQGESDKVTNQKDGSYIFNFDNNIGPKKIYAGEDNTTPESYIAKNCTPNSFAASTQNTLGTGNTRNAILSYIESIQQENNNNIKLLRENPKEEINYNSILNKFTMNGFYDWYRKNRGNLQNNNQQQPQPNSGNDNQSGQQTAQQPQPNNGNNNQSGQQTANSQSQMPIPNSNGTFNYKQGSILNANGWAYSEDALGRKIWVNTQNPKQAVFA